MKYILILLLLISTCQAQVINELTRTDRLLHLSAGYVITSGTTAILYNYTDVDWHAELIGLTTGIVAGIMKETLDDRTHQADMWDLGATVIGSGLAVVKFRVIIPSGRQQKYKFKFN